MPDRRISLLFRLKRYRRNGIILSISACAAGQRLNGSDVFPLYRIDKLQAVSIGF